MPGPERFCHLLGKHFPSCQSHSPVGSDSHRSLGLAVPTDSPTGWEQLPEGIPKQLLLALTEPHASIQKELSKTITGVQMMWETSKQLG